jgi:hypothetical protein
MTEVIKEYNHYGKDEDHKKSVNPRWWTEPNGQIFNHLFKTVDTIRERCSWRRTTNIRNARLYNDKEYLSLFPGFTTTAKATSNYSEARLTLNVIKSCVDTATSKIGKSKPRPYYLTQNGKWEQQRRAKRLTQYMEGWAYDNKVYESGRLVFRDGGVFGSGFFSGYKENGKVCVERAFPDEIIVDELEGIYGSPQTLYRAKYIARDVIMDAWGKNEKLNFAIKSATTAFNEQMQNSSKSDLLLVIEAWHLPSGPEAKDGKHVICIENADLLSEDWNKSRFPISKFMWTKPLLGFYGSSLADELVGIQVEINKILMDESEARHLMARPQIWLEMANKVNAHKTTNRTGGLNYYMGQPPVFISGTSMPPEVYAQLENLYRKAYEITGLSQMSATGKKPSGVDAAVALRELQDVESERFMDISLGFEETYLDLFDLVYDLHEELLEEGHDVLIQSRDKRAYQELHWSDVRIKKESFVTRSFPASLLPTTPAGRLSKTQELIQAGFIDKEQALSLLDFPDLEKFSNMKTAPLDNIMRIIELMLDGTPQTPEPHLNLQLAYVLTQEAFNSAKNDNAPDEILDLLLDFMDNITAMQTPPPAPPMPPMDPMAGGMPPVDPMAVPEPLPVSDLVPQVQGADMVLPTSGGLM